MAEAAQLEEEPKTSTEIEADPYAVAGMEPPGALSSSDASKLLIREETVMKDLEAQRALTALNASKRAAIVAESEKSQGPLRDEAVSAMRAREAAGEAVAAQPLPNLPQLPKVQDFMDRDTASMMAGIASLIAGFNSNGRVRGIRANQSLAAGLKGFQEGSLLRAKLGLEDWKNQVEQQMMEFKMIRQRNLDILQAKGMTIEDKLKEIELSNAPYKNQMMQATIEKEGIDGVVKIDQQMAGIINSMERVLGKADPAIQQMNLQYKQSQIDLNKARTEAAKTGGLPADLAKLPPGTPGQKNEALLATLDPNTAALVKKMANYELPISGFGGLDVKTRSRLVQLAALYDPTFDVKEYPTRVKVMADYSPAGASGRNITAINTMAYHIDRFKTAFEKLNNRQLKLWNTAQNKLKTNFGDPAITAVQLPANGVADELAKILKGGTAAPTDEEMQLWQSIFNTSMSPGQMKSTIWEAFDLAGGRLKQISTAYERAMNKPLDALYPDTKAIIAKNKPANEPTPSWLGGATTSQNYPRARNPKTGEELIFKDGKWQKPQ